MSGGWMPKCGDCGKFLNAGADGVSGRLDLSGGAVPDIEGERFRCKRCTEEAGPLPKHHRAADIPGYTHWVNGA